MNFTFYIALISSIVLFIIPSEYVMGVYSPNILGWIWFVVTLPLTFISFIWAGISNYKNKNWKELAVRSLIFIIVIFFSVAYWFYVA